MELVTVRGFCRIKYADSLRGRDPTKAQENTVTQMIRDGKFKSARKIGRSWFIDLDKELGNG